MEVLKKKESNIDQLRFRDRVHAGNILAERLSTSPSLNSRDRSQAIVLGIPRGGVIIGDIVSRKLTTDFDVAMGQKTRSSRKLRTCDWSYYGGWHNVH